MVGMGIADLLSIEIDIFIIGFWRGCVGEPVGKPVLCDRFGLSPRELC